MSIVLTGFQIMQLLAVCEHDSAARVVVTQQHDGLSLYTHARKADSPGTTYIPRDADEAERIARDKHERAEAARSAMASVKGD